MNFVKITLIFLGCLLIGFIGFGLAKSDFEIEKSIEHQDAKEELLTLKDPKNFNKWMVNCDSFSVQNSLVFFANGAEQISMQYHKPFETDSTVSFVLGNDQMEVKYFFIARANTLVIRQNVKGKGFIYRTLSGFLKSGFEETLNNESQNIKNLQP